jgi:hypothetical protein
MRHARDADFGTLSGRIPCLKNTRVDVLDKLMTWALGLQDYSQQIYWLNGHAGSGKSTIAQSVAEFLFSMEMLGASFFCSRNSSARSDLTMIIPTIAYQLARSTNAKAPAFRDALLRALRENPDLPFSSLQNQLDRLIVQPIEESEMSTVVVIDALDECRDESTTSTLLGFLAQNVSRIPTVKFFITSRPEQHIRSGFLLDEIHRRTDTMALYLINADTVEADIRHVLRTELTALACRRRELKLPEQWYTEDQVEQLAKKAGGLFIFASTAVKALDRKSVSPRKQILKLLDPTVSLYEGQAGLNELYSDILKEAVSEKYSELALKLQPILGILIIARDLVSATTVASLLGGDWDAEDVRVALDGLHSVLVVPENEGEPLQFYHKSFPDFLVDSSRCTDPRFQINRDDYEFTTAQKCFTVMERKLKRNICGLGKYTMNDTLDVSQRDNCIDESLKYSCRYWNEHILPDSHHLDTLPNSRRLEHLEAIRTILDRWFTTRLLQWLEVLSLLHELGQAVRALSSMREWFASVRRLFHLRRYLLMAMFNAVRRGL